MAEEIDIKARELGWVPKEEFRGDPEKWIDAETFVKRGEELMPLLKAHNRRLTEEVTQLKTTVKEAKDAIEALKETTSKEAIEKVKAKAKDIREKLVEAKKEGDVEAELELQEQLDEAKAAIKDAQTGGVTAKTAAATDTTKDYSQHPDWVAWTQANPWFGSDKRKTALALGIAQELREKGNTDQGRAFFDKVSDEVNETLGLNKRPTTSKVEGGSRGSGAGNGGGKSYADLPGEAKDICERQAERLVGPNRAFKTVAEWRAHYASEYFKE